MERHHGTFRRLPGHLPALLLAAIVALALLPLSIAADDPALTPALRDPSTTSGDFTLANGYAPPFLRDPGTILSTTPNNTDVGRPSPGPGWNWQTTGNLFTHTADFNASVTDGQEDGVVEYTEPPYRRAWAEGSYLGWTADRISAMQAYGACAYQGCSNYSFIAAVFHAFNKNTNAVNALKQNGWFATNLPGAYFSSPHDAGDEIRIFISDPNSMQPEPTLYYAQTYYQDTAYPGVKTNGEIDYSTYLVSFINPQIPFPTNRDFNRKICINNDNASSTIQDGSCP